MKRTEIAPGVHLSWDPAPKFNRCRISLHFAFPAKRETATAHALLPLVMERGYADCPDMTQMTKKLARLYGADLTVDARPLGANHNLCVSATGIKNRFALEGEDLTREYAALALGTAFHPAFSGGVFDPEAVAIEKQMLRKSLEDEVNEKRIYCQRQANREFFGASPAGIRQEGYLEEVDGLTPETLTAAYREMLETAQIELLILGCGEAETQAVTQALLGELAAVARRPVPLCENLAMPRQEAVRKTECFDTVQAKLCMLFTLGEPMQPDQMAAVRLAMALYGGSVTSRLFLNVRERDHLCYYCSSSFQSFTGSMAVNSGVEHADALTLRADTIFSALCHTALEVYGEPALEELLVSADADALRISDAMPWRGNSFYLPKPIAASTSPAELSTVERKAVKKLAWIPASKFDRYTASLHSGTYPLDELDQSFGQAYEQTKASVTDGADAKPYFVGLYRLHAGCGLYVLCACEGTDQIKLLKDLFTLLGLSGIGGRTSAGYGRFHLDGDPICLNTAEEESTRWMLQALERSTSPYLLLTSSLPAEEEMDAALEGASFQLVRRSGFAATEWVETPMKKQTQYFLAAGSVLQHPYQGKLYDVGTALPHPVYRYSKPLFMGVTL